MKNHKTHLCTMENVKQKILDKISRMEAVTLTDNFNTEKVNFYEQLLYTIDFQIVVKNPRTTYQREFNKIHQKER